MGAPDQQHGLAYRRPADVDSEAFARLEQQVAYNYNMIQGHHGEIGRLNEIVAQMQREMAAVVNVLEEVRSDLRARPAAPQPAESGRYDPGDIEVLSAHIAAVTTKANEVDNLKYQVELMRRRISRAEDTGAIRASARPGTSSSHPDAAAYEAQHAQAPPAQSLPPIRPGAGFAAEQDRHSSFATAPPPESQAGHAYHPAHAQPRQSIPNDHQVSQPHPPGFRPSEALPPPSALTGWRPAEAYSAPALPPPQPLRSNQLEHEAQTSAWAAVNLNQASKRSFDDQPMHDTSQPGSPKRPKLAPLKPRSSYGEEQVPSHQSPFAQVSHPDPSHLPRQRLSSGDAQAPPHSQFVPTPASATNNYRFITSTGQPDGQEPWRPDADRGMVNQAPHGTEGGRGRGRGGGRGSRGGRGRRGGRGGAQSASQAPEVPSQEIAQAPPEWRDSNWPGSQASPNGHFAGYHPFSPADVQRGVPVELAVHPGGVPPPPPPPPPQAPPQLQVAVAAPPGQEGEFPATPITGPADPFQGDSGKKSRTKPIRNAEGILIRKDGRPDMRSVSSANNLRKVHAKKEAERAEMEGRTPTSARSLAPANSSSLSDDEGEDHDHEHDEHDGELDDHEHEHEHGHEHDEREDSASRTGTPGTQAEKERHHGAAEQHRAYTDRILDVRHDSERPKSTAEAWFPRRDDTAIEVKRENQERELAGRWRGAEDVAMEEPSQHSEPSQQVSEQASKEQTPKQVSEAATSELTDVSRESKGAEAGNAGAGEKEMVDDVQPATATQAEAQAA